MALDKLVDSTQLDSDLTSVADAIRTKGGTSAQLAFPAGFVDAVEAIETGGENEQGLIALTINYTDSDNRTWAGTIEDNSIKNFSTSSTYMNIPLVLRIPIVIQTGDVISITVEDKTGGSFFANAFLLSVVYRSVSSTPKISVQDNFLFKDGNSTISTTYSKNPVPIYAIGFESRASSITSMSAKIHLDINNVRIF